MGADAALGVVSLIIAIPGLVDLSIEYGNNLRKKLAIFNAVEEHSRLQLFVTDLTHGQMNDIMLFFSDVREQLPPDFLDEFSHALKVLNTVMATALEAFPPDSLAGQHSKKSKVKYALYDAKKVEQAIQLVDLWKHRFTERAMVFLQFRFLDHRKRSQMAVKSQPQSEPGGADSESLVERLRRIEIRRHQKTGPVLLSALADMQLKPVEYSPLHLLLESDQLTEQLVKYRDYTGMDSISIEGLRATVRNVASQLREVDSLSMSILECLGFSDDIVKRRFALHFAVPHDGTNPRSLRSLLIDPVDRNGRKHSLSDRVQLAQSIASAVLYVHSSNFVHKSIRPENIIIFEPNAEEETTSAEKRLQKYPYIIGKAYLAGYDGVREEKAACQLIDITDRSQRLYVAPERLSPRENRPKFSWRHDVYSLGVVLLEIACWESFTDPQGRIGKALLSHSDPSKEVMNVAKQVPRLMGNNFAAATNACLNMFSEDGQDVAFRDNDGVLLGASYISRVLDKLEAIVL